MGIPAVRKLRSRFSRTTKLNSDLAKSQFDFFSTTAGDLHGKIVVEIGPGDKLALAQFFIEAGASRYIAVDRFISSKNKSGDKIQVINSPIENLLIYGLADIIISFATLEHLTDLPKALSVMSTMLKPNGIMIHRVDYGPHSPWDKNELGFLAIPDTLWKLMGSNRGYPNRIRHTEVSAILYDLGFQTAERIRRTASDGSALDVEFASAYSFMPTLGQASKP